MFVTNVANVGQAKTCKIELKYQEVIDYRSGTFALRFPDHYHAALPSNYCSATRARPDVQMLKNSQLVYLRHQDGITPIYSPSSHSDTAQSEFSLIINIDVGLELVRYSI